MVGGILWERSLTAMRQDVQFRGRRPLLQGALSYVVGGILWERSLTAMRQSLNFAVRDRSYKGGLF